MNSSSRQAEFETQLSGDGESMSLRGSSLGGGISEIYSSTIEFRLVRIQSQDASIGSVWLCRGGERESGSDYMGYLAEPIPQL